MNDNDVMNEIKQMIENIIIAFAKKAIQLVSIAQLTKLTIKYCDEQSLSPKNCREF